jgi:hypothetical protein
MGLFTDKFVKNKDAKFWITLIVDVFIIFYLTFVFLSVKAEWNKGFDDCSRQACIICMNQSPVIFP